jgi:predicted acetyltransferase
VPAEVGLRAASPGDRDLVERLWQLHAHDLSEYRGSLPGEDGRYRADRVERYFTEPDRRVYLVQTGAPVGFVMVRQPATGPSVLGELFVVRAVRRRGLGRDAARKAIATRAGRWEVAFQEENPGAARFWRRIATELAGTDWREEARPVPDKPDRPPDLWISFDTRTLPSLR